MLLTTSLLLGLIPPPGDPFNLTITELDCDTDGTDMLEFIELYDGGVGNSPLDGFVLVLYNGGSTDSAYITADLDGFTTDANGYLVWGNDAVVPMPQIPLGNNSLQNGADAIALYVGEGVDFPFGAPVTTVGLIDAIVYDTNDDDDPELLALDIKNRGQINEDQNGNKNFHSIQVCPTGISVTFPTPAAGNDCSGIIPGTQNYCTSFENSSGNAATISYTGSTNVFDDDFSLMCTGMPVSDDFGYFVFTVSEGQSGAQLPFGENGLQCISTPFCRLYSPGLSVGGVGTRSLTAADFGPFPVGNDCVFGAPTPGSTLHFQCYMRDPNAIPPVGLATSDAVSVTFDLEPE